MSTRKKEELSGVTLFRKSKTVYRSIMHQKF